MLVYCRRVVSACFSRDCSGAVEEDVKLPVKQRYHQFVLLLEETAASAPEQVNKHRRCIFVSSRGYCWYRDFTSMEYNLDCDQKGLAAPSPDSG